MDSVDSEGQLVPVKKTVTPLMFDEYFYFACMEYQVPVEINITRLVREQYQPDQKKSRIAIKQKEKEKSDMTVKNESVSVTNQQRARDLGSLAKEIMSEGVQITTVYDQNENLTEIQFSGEEGIPREIMIILALIVKFHTFLVSIKINKGVDAYNLYELNKVTKVSNIAYICLDDANLCQLNCQILLETPCKIKQLSLRNCKINDDMVKKIAEQLYHPLQASKSLVILNLASNAISAIGARYLADALRSNRTLAYLNLCHNRLQDEGAMSILSTLSEFVLTYNEVFGYRGRYTEFLKSKDDLIMQYLAELKANKRRDGPAKKKVKLNKKDPSEKEFSCKEFESHIGSDCDVEKATLLAESNMGKFKDPFMRENTIVKDDVVSCTGNFVLCYLNLAYNNLTYPTLVALLNTLNYQKNQKSRLGLINVVLEGNYLPKDCDELAEINHILEAALTISTANLINRKKNPAKYIGSKMTF